jgi:hypothetical protein
VIIGGVCAAVTFAAMRALRLRGERWPSGPTTPSPPPPPLPLCPSEIRLASRRPVRPALRRGCLLGPRQLSSSAPAAAGQGRVGQPPHFCFCRF